MRYFWLLRFRAGQQHAIVERVEEPLLADPALLLDQDAMHHRYLARRSAEAEQRDPDPDAHRLANADAVLVQRLDCDFSASAGIDRTSAGSGKSVSVRVDLGGRR